MQFLIAMGFLALIACGHLCAGQEDSTLATEHADDILEPEMLQLDEVCKFHTQCRASDRNSDCLGAGKDHTSIKRCQCRPTATRDGGKCFENLRLGAQCSDSRECITRTPNSQCERETQQAIARTCTCRQWYVRFNGQCLPQRALDESCHFSEQCRSKDSLSECTTDAQTNVKSCKCRAGYKKDEWTISCKYDLLCRSDADCSTGYECRSSTCLPKRTRVVAPNMSTGAIFAIVLGPLLFLVLVAVLAFGVQADRRRRRELHQLDPPPRPLQTISRQMSFPPTPFNLVQNNGVNSGGNNAYPGVSNSAFTYSEVNLFAASSAPTNQNTGPPPSYSQANAAQTGAKNE